MDVEIIDQVKEIIVEVLASIVGEHMEDVQEFTGDDSLERLRPWVYPVVCHLLGVVNSDIVHKKL